MDILYKIILKKQDVITDLGGFEPPTLGSEVPRHVPG